MSKILFEETAASSYRNKAKETINSDEVLTQNAFNDSEEKKETHQPSKVEADKVPTVKREKKSIARGIKIIPPQKEETRTKAVNFKIKPSLKVMFQEKCEKIGISQNNAIEQLIEIFVNMDD